MIKRSPSQSSIFGEEARGTFTKIKNKIKVLPITNIINVGLEVQSL